MQPSTSLPGENALPGAAPHPSTAGTVGACGTVGRLPRDTIRRCGYGACTSCACPGFSGGGYQCSRGGCGHHYDTHW